MPPRTRRKWVPHDEMPPQQGGPRGKYDWYEIAADLQNHPNLWTLIDAEASISLPGAVTRGRLRALRSDEWDYEVRTYNNNQETKTCEMHMRAVPKG